LANIVHFKKMRGAIVQALAFSTIVEEQWIERIFSRITLQAL